MPTPRTDPLRVNEELAELLGARLGVGGAGFEKRVRKAGRTLPRRVRRAARELLEAERFAGHPMLARRLDPDRLDRSAAICRNYLQSVDPADRRRGRIIGILAVVAFNLLLAAALLVALLAWRGYLGPAV